MVSPHKPGEKTLEELTTALKQLFDATPSEIVQQYKFNSCYRQPRETIATFMSELRSLAEICNYGASLDEMLRDCLVCGINNNIIQRRLFAETKLTLPKALEIALGVETAAKNADTLSQGIKSGGIGELQTGDVHKPHVPVKRTGTTNNCYRCGRNGHSSATCRFREAKCHNCETGHLKNVCWKKIQKQSTEPQENLSVKCIVEESEENIKEYSLYNTSTSQKPKPMMKTEDITLSMELDTGASVSIISEKTYKTLLSSKALEKSTVSLCTYTGEPLDVMGSMEVEVKYKSQEARMPLLLVTGEGPSLLGRDWLQQIQLDWREIHSLQDDPLEAILHQYEKLFQEGLGTMQGYKARFMVDDKVKPKFCKAPPVPYAMRALVEQKLDRLTKEGIIEPVQFAE